MTTSRTINPLPGYPTVRLTRDGEQMTVRPLVPDDKQALLEFFRGIPEEERFYLKDDVTSSSVIDQWIERMDYSRVLPLVATRDGKIIADATLHHGRAGARKHTGEIRVLVLPQHRDQGVARTLLRELIQIASGRGLEKLVFEVVAGIEESARYMAQIVGFVPIGSLRDHVRDIDGTAHDLVILELDVKIQVREGVFLGTAREAF